MLFGIKKNLIFGGRGSGAPCFFRGMSFFLLSFDPIAAAMQIPGDAKDFDEYLLQIREFAAGRPVRSGKPAER